MSSVSSQSGGWIHLFDSNLYMNSLTRVDTILNRNFLYLAKISLSSEKKRLCTSRNCYILKIYS